MKYLLFWVSISVTISAHTQSSTPNSVVIEKDYSKLAKKQNTTAWIMLGGGIAIATAGGLVSLDNSLWEFRGPYSGTEEKFTTGVVIFIAGAALAVGSIPVFIIASGNKRAGKNLSAQLKIQLQKTESIGQGLSINKTYPALTLKIKF